MLLSDFARELKKLKTNEILTPEEFLMSEYYSGFVEGQIYEFWKREIADFINNDYVEWIITGSLGSGKSLASCLTMAYMIYHLFSNDNIFEYLQMPKQAYIYGLS